MSLEALLKKIFACFSTEQPEQDVATIQSAVADVAEKRPTLEEAVKPIEAEAAFETPAGFGDRATSYTLELSSYENTTKAYAADYSSKAVELNDKSTQAMYTVEITDEGVYEAVAKVAQDAREADIRRTAKTMYAQDLDVRETSGIFKSLNPIRWFLLYSNPEMAREF